MKLQILFLIIAMQVDILYAQNPDCNFDNKNNQSPERSYNCEESQFHIDPSLSYKRNTKKHKKLNVLKKNQAPTNTIDAYVKPLNYAHSDVRNSNNRYQYNLDNFRSPRFSCVLPELDDSEAALRNYDQNIIKKLHRNLNEYHNCLIASGQQNRALFKQLIVKGLDGKITPSETKVIKWAVFPEYQEQTNLLFNNINELYEQRYTNYAISHNKLRTIIKRYNSSLVKNK